MASSGSRGRPADDGVVSAPGRGCLFCGFIGEISGVFRFKDTYICPLNVHAEDLICKARAPFFADGNGKNARYFVSGLAFPAGRVILVKYLYAVFRCLRPAAPVFRLTNTNPNSGKVLQNEKTSDVPDVPRARRIRLRRRPLRLPGQRQEERPRHDALSHYSSSVWVH